MINYIYIVHDSNDRDLLYDEFDTREEAMEYANECVEQGEHVVVEQVEIELNDFWEVVDSQEPELIWSSDANPDEVEVDDEIEDDDYYTFEDEEELDNDFLELGEDYEQNSYELDDSYDYQLLSRLKQDCDYFLGNGNGAIKHLWAGDVKGQIDKMRELYSKLQEKPEWLTSEDIDNYEERMLDLLAAREHPVDEAMKVKDNIIEPDLRDVKTEKDTLKAAEPVTDEKTINKSIEDRISDMEAKLGIAKKDADPKKEVDTVCKDTEVILHSEDDVKDLKEGCAPCEQKVKDILTPLINKDKTDLRAVGNNEKLPKGFKFKTRTRGHGIVSLNGKDFAYALVNGELRVMSDKDAGWNWSETILKESLLHEGVNEEAASTVAALLEDEWEAVKGYEDAAAKLDTLEVEDKERVLHVLEHISEEEAIHVGQLEQILHLLKPDYEAKQEEGHAEGAEELAGEDLHDEEEFEIEDPEIVEVEEALDYDKLREELEENEDEVECQICYNLVPKEEAIKTDGGYYICKHCMQKNHDEEDDSLEEGLLDPLKNLVTKLKASKNKDAINKARGLVNKVLDDRITKEEALKAIDDLNKTLDDIQKERAAADTHTKKAWYAESLNEQAQRDFAQLRKVITSGIRECMSKYENFSQVVNQSVYKFMNNDWGTVDKEDAEANNESVAEEDILDRYMLGSYIYEDGETEIEFWIIQNSGVLTVLLPEEY